MVQPYLDQLLPDAGKDMIKASSKMAYLKVKEHWRKKRGAADAAVTIVTHLRLQLRHRPHQHLHHLKPLRKVHHMKSITGKK